jgi:hypothetical protein
MEGRMPTVDSDLVQDFGGSPRNLKALKMLGVSEKDIIEKGRQEMISRSYSENTVNEEALESIELSDFQVTSPKALRTLGISEVEKKSSMLKSFEKPPRLSIHEDELSKFEWDLPLISSGVSLPSSPTAYTLMQGPNMSSQNLNRLSTLSSRMSIDSLRSNLSQRPAVPSPLADHKLLYHSTESLEADSNSEKYLPRDDSLENDLNLIQQADLVASEKAKKLLGVETPPSKHKISGRTSIFQAMTGRKMMSRMSILLGTKKAAKDGSKSTETMVSPVSNIEPRETLANLETEMLSCGYLLKSDLNVTKTMSRSFFVLVKDRICQFKSHHNSEPVLGFIPINENTKISIVDPKKLVLELVYRNVDGNLTVWYLQCIDVNEFQRWHDEILMEIEIDRFSKLDLPDLPAVDPDKIVDSTSIAKIISLFSKNVAEKDAIVETAPPIQSAIAILEAIQKRDSGLQGH